MLERICPACGHGNEIEAVLCIACGTRIEQPLARRAQSELSRRWNMVPEHWQTAAKALAIGATALAIEAGASLLRQQTTGTTGTDLARTTPARSPRRHVAQRRVWRTYNDGQLQRETWEETHWFEE